LSDPALVLPQEIEPAIEHASRSYWRAVARRLARDKVAMLCLTILLLIILAAILAPLIAPGDPYKASIIRRLKPPGTPGALLGTDELGRDLLTRLIYGGRLSLFMGFTPVLIASLIGSSIGIAAGYAGGWINMVVMRIVDVFYAFPSVLLAVAISGVLGAGVGNGLLALTITFIPSITRVAESVTTQIRNQDFVEAARATGAGAHHVLLTHVLSNVLGPILVYASGLVSVAIVIASGLSFLGLGVSPPEPEWGLMLNTMRQAIYVAPINAVLPGMMIFVTSMCFNLLGDGLRGAMDRKS
jgi:peptide/nickel transport system permease protein